jgi:hypothetical protein
LFLCSFSSFPSFGELKLLSVARSSTEGSKNKSWPKYKYLCLLFKPFPDGAFFCASDSLLKHVLRLFHLA